MQSGYTRAIRSAHVRPSSLQGTLQTGFFPFIVTSFGILACTVDMPFLSMLKHLSAWNGMYELISVTLITKCEHPNTVDNHLTLNAMLENLMTLHLVWSH